MLSQKSVKLSFSRSAKKYAKYAALQKDVSMRLVKDFVPPAIDQPKKILDVGCGTGFTAMDAKRRWRNSGLAAVDIAAPMALEAKKAGISQAAVADAAVLPFKDGAFDLVVSSLVFQWAFFTGPLFDELARVMVKGGRIFFSTLGPGTLKELRDAYNTACLECTGKPALFKSMPGKDDLAEKMINAGFNEISSTFQTVVRSYPSVHDFFKTLKGTGATLPGRPENPPRRDVLAKTIERYSSSGSPVNATYEVIYISGRRI
ncbi:MAG: malonyl-[acyl-carrier protein] O-methyltransferase [bacterium]|nr:MAG: malonyl-[acyl-carrier protein] O-methyltransferase [bacterium]